MDSLYHITEDDHDKTWWLMPIMPVLRMQRQGDGCEFRVT